MTKTVKIKGEDFSLTDAEAALILVIQELTQAIATGDGK